MHIKLITTFATVNQGKQGANLAPSNEAIWQCACRALCTEVHHGKAKAAHQKPSTCCFSVGPCPGAGKTFITRGRRNLRLSTT